MICMPETEVFEFNLLIIHLPFKSRVYCRWYYPALFAQKRQGAGRRRSIETPGRWGARGLSLRRQLQDVPSPLALVFTDAMLLKKLDCPSYTMRTNRLVLLLLYPSR